MDYERIDRELRAQGHTSTLNGRRALLAIVLVIVAIEVVIFSIL